MQVTGTSELADTWWLLGPLRRGQQGCCQHAGAYLVLLLSAHTIPCPFAPALHGKPSACSYNLHQHRREQLGGLYVTSLLKCRLVPERLSLGRGVGGVGVFSVK